MKYTIAVFSIILIVNTVHSQGIGEFRGPGRTGEYPDRDLMKQWPEKGPEQVLKITGFGAGYSQPVVYNNHIFISGTKDTMNLVSAYTMKGKLIWQMVYGKYWIRTNPENRCTPTIEGDRLFIPSGVGDISCLNTRTGKIIWTVNASKLYQGEIYKHGEAESLLLTDKAVIYTTGGEKNSVIALSKSDGSLIWKSKSLGGPKSYASPVLIERGGLKIILAQTAKHLIGINAENGDVLWNHDIMQYYNTEQGIGANTNPPLVYKNDIFITSGYNHPALMFTLAGDACSVTLKWKNETLDCHLGGVVRVEDDIYGSTWENNSKGKWASVDWETGTVNWETEWYTKGSVITADGMLYLVEEKNGNVALVKPDKSSLKIISTFRMTEGDGAYWAHPAIYGGLLFIRHGDVLTVYKIKATGNAGNSLTEKSRASFSSYSDIYTMIRSEVPGVQVSGTQIFIQGTKTYGGSNAALLVVDGRPVEDLNNVSPYDVKSIRLIKDSEAAIYGMRGANGVLVLETLTGGDKK